MVDWDDEMQQEGHIMTSPSSITNLIEVIKNGGIMPPQNVIQRLSAQHPTIWDEIATAAGQNIKETQRANGFKMKKKTGKIYSGMVWCISCYINQKLIMMIIKEQLHLSEVYSIQMRK